MFNNATVAYQEAMQKSGYHNKLKYQDPSSPTILAKMKKNQKKLYGSTSFSVNMSKVILEELFLIYSKSIFPPTIASTKSAA